jgi:hypothetical protein
LEAPGGSAGVERHTRKGGVMSIHRPATITLGLALVAIIGSRTAAAEGARINFDVSALEKQAKSTVNVTITPQTIDWALQAMSQRGEDTAAARQALKGIDQVVVRVYEFEEAQPWDELAKAANPILAQLKGTGWTPVVSVSENGKEGREIVNVSLYTDPAGKPGGLAVLVVEAKELVIVNVAGPVDLAKLSEIMKTLNLGDIPGIGAAGSKGKDKHKDKGTAKQAE